MRRAGSIVLLAFLAAASAEGDDRQLQFGISVVAGGCFKIPADQQGDGKLTVIACIDSKAAAALKEAKVTAAYARLTGVFTNGAKSGVCSYWWEGITSDYQSLSKFPPMLMVQPEGTLGASEAVNFSLVLPMDQNPGVTAVTGGTGLAVGCQRLEKDQVEGIAGAAATTTTVTPAAETAATSDKEEEGAAAAAAAAVDEQAAEAGQLPAPVAGDAPEVKKDAISPAHSLTASLAGLAAVAAALAFPFVL